MYYLHKKGYRVSLDSPSDTKCNRLQAYKRNNGKINKKYILQNHLVHKIVHGIVCARVDDHVACVRVYDVKIPHDKGYNSTPQLCYSKKRMF
jgi:hypothetical protein